MTAVSRTLCPDRGEPPGPAGPGASSLHTSLPHRQCSLLQPVEPSLERTDRESFAYNLALATSLSRLFDTPLARRSLPRSRSRRCWPGASRDYSFETPSVALVCLHVVSPSSLMFVHSLCPNSRCASDYILVSWLSSSVPLRPRRLALRLLRPFGSGAMLIKHTPTQSSSPQSTAMNERTCWKEYKESFLQSSPKVMRIL